MLSFPTKLPQLRLKSQDWQSESVDSVESIEKTDPNEGKQNIIKQSSWTFSLVLFYAVT